MRRENAIKLVRQMRRYDDHACRKPRHNGFVIKQVFFPKITQTEYRIADDATDASHLRRSRRIWVSLDRLKSDQGSLVVRRLVYQLRRHPIDKLPLVVALPGGFYALWDGNHRATSALLIGRTRIRCEEIRKVRP